MKKILIFILCMLFLGTIAGCKKQDEDSQLDAKPVIYLYPKEKTKVSVSLNYTGKLTVSYPKYDEGWNVTAYPDGTLIDENHKKYNYLFWEGIDSNTYTFEEGFCVKGEDAAAFLEEKLDLLGLNRTEANEFIVYWLPIMEANEYNLVSFNPEAYLESTKLVVNPTPDTVIRVFMVVKASNKYVEITPQVLEKVTRSGFTVVEWGGAQAK